MSDDKTAREILAQLCPRFGKWLRGCRFEARMEIGPPTFDLAKHLAQHVGATPPLDSELIAQRQSCPQIYVRDVCIRCGKTIERSGSNVPH